MLEMIMPQIKWHRSSASNYNAFFELDSNNNASTNCCLNRCAANDNDSMKIDQNQVMLEMISSQLW